MIEYLLVGAMMREAVREKGGKKKKKQTKTSSSTIIKNYINWSKHYHIHIRGKR